MTRVAELGILSFNIWRNGGRSLPTTIDVIRGARADVVGLQECDAVTARTIAKALAFDEVHDKNGNVVLSRYPMVGVIGRTADEWGGLGATIELSPGQRIHVFDAHLHYASYGPYHLQDGRPAAFVVEEEERVRMPGLDELLRMMTASLASGEPTFLVGDFNAPSHLDYASLPWPESVACHVAGLVDSYRVLHPGDRTWPPAFAEGEPGITWTPISAEEPRGVFDRIDFIYYAPLGVGPRSLVRPSTSVALDGQTSAAPWATFGSPCRVSHAPWPSDHRAVLTTFVLA